MQYYLTIISDIDWTSVIITAGSVVGAILLILSFFKKCRAAVWTPIDNKFFKPKRERFAKLDNHFQTVEDLKKSSERIEAELKVDEYVSVKHLVVQTRDVCGYLSARTRHQDDSSEDPIFELSADGALNFANCAFCELLNADEKELLYRKYLSRANGVDRDRLISELKQAAENRMPLDTVIKFNTGTPDGSVSVRLMLSPDVRHGGDLRGFFGRASRITT